MWQTLDSEVYVAASSHLELRATSLLAHLASFALMVGGCSRFGITKILTSMMQIRRVVTSEIDTLCRTILLQSSCMPLSRYISQVKC